MLWRLELVVEAAISPDLAERKELLGTLCRDAGDSLWFSLLLLGEFTQAYLWVLDGADKEEWVRWAVKKIVSWIPEIEHLEGRISSTSSMRIRQLCAIDTGRSPGHEWEIGLSKLLFNLGINISAREDVGHGRLIDELCKRGVIKSDGVRYEPGKLLSR